MKKGLFTDDSLIWPVSWVYYCHARSIHPWNTFLHLNSPFMGTRMKNSMKGGFRKDERRLIRWPAAPLKRKQPPDESIPFIKRKAHERPVNLAHGSWLFSFIIDSWSSDLIFVGWIIESIMGWRFLFLFTVISLLIRHLLHHKSTLLFYRRWRIRDDR